MGHKTTSINIYKDGKLLMPRQIPVGGEMFTKAIADALSVSNEDAERLKCEKSEIPASASIDTFGSSPFDASAGGAPGATQEFQPYNPFSDDPTGAGTPDPVAVEQTQAIEPGGPVADPNATGTFDPFHDAPMSGASSTPPPSNDASPVPVGDPESARLYQAMAPVIDEFLAEIRRSVDYFRSRGGDIQRIVLCGGGTKLKGLAPFISKNLGMECDPYDPLRRLNVNPRRVAPGFAEEHKQEFAIAIGNGLHIFFD
jgi:type IV pilus assembly protein PilM